MSIIVKVISYMFLTGNPPCQTNWLEESHWWVSHIYQSYTKQKEINSNLNFSLHVYNELYIHINVYSETFTGSKEWS